MKLKDCKTQPWIYYDEFKYSFVDLCSYVQLGEFRYDTKAKFYIFYSMI